MNTEHTDYLESLYTRLINEKERFARDGSPLRAVWIAQIKREIKSAEAFLGLPAVDCTMTDDELLAALFAP